MRLAFVSTPNGASYETSIMRADIAIPYNLLEGSGHERLLLNSRGDKITLRSLNGRLLDWKADMIFYYVCPTSKGEVLGSATAIKKAGARPIICIIGKFAHILYRELLSYGQIDYCLIGDPENSIEAFVENIARGRSITSLPGLAYRNDDSIACNRIIEIEGIDPLRIESEPIVRREGRYSALASRGCGGNCSFCIHPLQREMTHSYELRKRSPRAVARELASISEANRARAPIVDFVDPDFLSKRGPNDGWISEFVSEMKAAGVNVHFTIMARVHAIDSATVESLKSVGLSGVYLGVENFDDTALRRFRKGFTRAEALRALKTLDDASVYYRFGLILFWPFARLEEIETNLEALESLGYSSKTQFRWPISLAFKMDLFEGTPIYRDAKSAGLLTEGTQYRYADERVARMERFVHEWRPSVEWMNAVDFFGYFTSKDVHIFKLLSLFKSLKLIMDLDLGVLKGITAAVKRGDDDCAIMANVSRSAEKAASLAKAVDGLVKSMGGSNDGYQGKDSGRAREAHSQLIGSQR